MHELQIAGKRYLLDCGLYQGRRSEAEQRNRNLPIPANAIDAVILSHAHIDHSGNLPLLVKNGFTGPIYATPATIDLCAAMLMDTAHIQEQDVRFVNKRRTRDGEPPVQPLYTTADAQRTQPLFQPIAYHAPKVLDDQLSCEFYDAGHILGSAIVLLDYGLGQTRTRLIFTGDLGRPKLPVIRDPDPAPPADYLIIESTYGGRRHEDEGPVADRLADIISRTCARGGKIIVPAFAVGRTQQLIFVLHELALQKRIPNIPIFIDSPLAVNVTQVFRKHPECFDSETMRYLTDGQDPFGFQRLQYIREAAESKKLNDLRGPFIVISASGMCESGRILHHLRNNIEDPRNCILITGFQAQNTLGRKLVEGQPEVRIFGEPMRVRAEVLELGALSGHADSAELMDWIKPLAPQLKRVFLVHGEPEQSALLAKAIQAEYGVEAVAAERGQSFDLAAHS